MQATLTHATETVEDVEVNENTVQSTVTPVTETPAATASTSLLEKVLVGFKHYAAFHSAAVAATLAEERRNNG